MHASGIDRSLLNIIDQQSLVTFKCDFGQSATFVDKSEKRGQFWIPLPYHPVYFREIKATLRRISDMKEFKELVSQVFNQAIVFNAAWGVDSQPIASIVRKF